MEALCKKRLESPPCEFANGRYSANCTAVQLRLRKGHCLKHAQNRWISGLLHKKTALKVYMVLQRDFKHELHVNLSHRNLSQQGPTVGSTGSLLQLSLRVMCGVGLRSQ